MRLPHSLILVTVWDSHASRIPSDQVDPGLFAARRASWLSNRNSACLIRTAANGRMSDRYGAAQTGTVDRLARAFGNVHSSQIDLAKIQKRRKLTSTSTATATGLPSLRAGSNRHWRTASRAFSSRPIPSERTTRKPCAAPSGVTTRDTTTVP